jgi:colanic acid/amylovoran biosynthesis glycosyltransferase
MHKMKVLQCFDNYLSLTENWAYRLLSNIPNVENSVIAREFLKANNYHPNFTFYDNPLPSYYKVFDNKALNSLHFRSLQKVNEWLWPLYLNKVLTKENFAVMHSHYGPTAWHYLKFARKSKIQHVISFYGFDYKVLPNNYPVWLERYKILFKEAHAFVCEGKYGVQQLIDLGCPPEKVHVVHLGVEPDKIPYHNRTKSEGNLQLLQVASFREKKGFIYTVKAFKNALKDCPNMHLTLVGGASGNPIYNEILAYLKEHQIEHKVTILAAIDFPKLHEFMENFHVFIHPSCHAKDGDCEGGAPVVLLDAQATGMPVISTFHCDIPEEVVHEQTGFLVEERDIEALTSCIKTMYFLPEEQYTIFSKRARSHIEKKFDIRMNSNALKEIYDQLNS